MAGPLARLSQSASRALPFIESGLSRGLSTSALQSELSAAGLGVRRQDLLTAVRGIRDAELSAERLKYVRYDYRPSPDLLANAITSQLRDFSYRVKISGYNPVSQQTEERYVNVSTNEILSRQEIEETAASYVIDETSGFPSSAPGFEIDQTELISATRK